MTEARFTASLKAVEQASAAFALLVSLQERFPRIRQDLARGNFFLQGAWGCVFKQYPQINGANLIKPPAALIAAKPIKYAAVVADEDEEWEVGCDPDAMRCKALLVEILKRAAYDWVLYRLSSKLEHKELAEDAFTWLFKEDETHPDYKSRSQAIIETATGHKLQGARVITSFLAICDCLGLEPEAVRERVRHLDPVVVRAGGRPVESYGAESTSVEEHGVVLDLNMDAMPAGGDYVSNYESYGSIATPSRLF